MKGAAPAAKAVGVSVEETTALLGTLANAGISGSKAGNNLKTSFINLNAAGLTLDEGLEKVANSEDKLGTAAKLVGKNAAASFLVLAEGVDVTEELSKGLNNAGGAAQKMAKEQLDTLEGSVKILGSTVDGFVLSLLSGDGAFNSVSRGIVQATTSILAFLTATEDANEVTFESAIANKKLADESQNLLNEYETLVKDGIEPTAEEKEKLEIITLKLKDKLGESVIAINEETGAFELNTEAVKAQIKAKRFASDEEAATLASRLKGVQEEIEAIEKQRETEKRIQELRTKDFEQTGAREVEIEDQKQAALSKTGNLVSTLNKEQKESKKQLEKADKDLRDSQQELNDQKEEEADLIEKLKELNFTAKDVEALFTEEIEKNTEATEGNNKAKKGLTQAQKDYNKELNKQIELLKIQREKELLLEGDELEKIKIEEDFLKKIYDLEIKYKGLTKHDKLVLDKEYANDSLDLELKTNEEKLQRNRDYLDKEAEIRLFYAERQVTFANEEIELERKKLSTILKDKESTNKQIIDQNDEIEKDLIFRLSRELALEDKRRKELLIGVKEGSNEELLIIAESEERKRKLINKTNEDILDLHDKETLDLKNKLDSQTTLWEEYGQAINEVITQIFDKWKETQEKRIEGAKEEVEESEENTERQFKRAEEGLENTYKFEQEERARREQRLIEEQKRLEKIQKLESFYNTYNANLSSLKEGQDSGTALAKTLRDVAIIEAISTFEDGGIVGVDGQGVKTDSNGVTVGKRHKGGGIKAEFEGGEGFLSRKEMKNMGAENFYQIKKAAKENRINDLVQANTIQMTGVDFGLKNEMSELTAALQNVELNKGMNFEKIAKDLFKMIVTTKKGNKTTNRTHYLNG